MHTINYPVNKAKLSMIRNLIEINRLVIATLRIMARNQAHQIFTPIPLTTMTDSKSMRIFTNRKEGKLTNNLKNRQKGNADSFKDKLKNYRNSLLSFSTRCLGTNPIIIKQSPNIKDRDNIRKIKRMNSVKEGKNSTKNKRKLNKESKD